MRFLQSNRFGSSFIKFLLASLHKIYRHQSDLLIYDHIPNKHHENQAQNGESSTTRDDGVSRDTSNSSNNKKQLHVDLELPARFLVTDLSLHLREPVSFLQVQQIEGFDERHQVMVPLVRPVKPPTKTPEVKSEIASEPSEDCKVLALVPEVEAPKARVTVKCYGVTTFLRLTVSCILPTTNKEDDEEDRIEGLEEDEDDGVELLRSYFGMLEVDGMLLHCAPGQLQLIPALNAAKHLFAAGRPESSDADFLAALSLMKARKFVQSCEIWSRCTNSLLARAKGDVVSSPPESPGTRGTLSINPFAQSLSRSSCPDVRQQKLKIHLRSHDNLQKFQLNN